MIAFFDTAYVAKCYLNEPDAEPVRSLAATLERRHIADWTRVELACVLHRHFREGRLSKTHVSKLTALFEDDLANRVWEVEPVSPALLNHARDRVLALPREVFIRAGDALQLCSALQAGASVVFSNDRHLLAAAGHFGLEGRSI